MKKLIGWIFLILLCPFVLRGQFQEIEFQIPSSASLMQSVDYPVSHSTGIPDISLPLYSINCGDLTLPVVLSFHVDAFMRSHRIAEAPGLGWSLTTDIKITRSINGADDLAPDYGYYFRRNLPLSTEQIRSYTPDIPYQYRVYDGSLDEEPDKFYYRLLDKSGTFYFRHTPDGVTTTQVPNNGVKVEYNPTTWSFEITDTDGTVYYFPNALTDKITNETMRQVPVGWNCSRIVSASRADTISFGYAKIQNHYKDYFETIEVYDRYTGGAMLGNWGELIEGFGVPPGGVPVVDIRDKNNFAEIKNIKVVYRHYDPYGPNDNSDLYIYSKYGMRAKTVNNFNFPKYSDVITESYYPERINYRGGMLDFTYQHYETLYDPREKLISIDAYGAENKLIKEIRFERDPESAITRKYQGKALTSILNGDEEYKFTYDFRNHSDLQHPYADFWGYAYKNSVPLYKKFTLSGMSSLTQVPNGYLVEQFGQGDPCPPVGSLYEPVMTIQYPTKGSVNFIFEANRFLASDNMRKLSGGFRIKKISYKDEAGNLMREKNYRYGNNEDGNGLLRFEPYLNDTGGNCHTEQTVNYVNKMSENQFVTVCSERKRTIFTFPASSTSFGSGSTIFYKEVAEYESDMGVSTGKTIYRYDTPERFNDRGTSYEAPPFIFGEYTWDMGYPVSVTRYKYENGNYEWVNKIEYAYSKYEDSTPIYIGKVWPLQYAQPLNFSIMYTGFEPILYAYFFSYRKMAFKTGNMQLNSVKESDRSDSGTVREKLTNYYYDNPNNYTANRSETFLHDGTVLTDQTIYPEDYASSAEIQNFISRNIVSIPLEKIVRRDNKMVSGQLYKYRSDGKIVEAYSLDRELAESDFKLSNKPIGYFGPGNSVYSPYSGYEKDVEIVYGGAYSLPVEVIEHEGEKRIFTCYLWGYKGSYPIAVIKNASYEQVSRILGEAYIRNLEESPGLLNGKLYELKTLLYNNTQLPGVQISLYQYRPNIGIISQTDPSGKMTYYDYDSQGRLTSVRDDKMNLVEDYKYNFKKEGL